MKTNFPKFVSSGQAFPKLLEEVPNESLPSREEIYSEGYEQGYQDAMELAQKINKDALQMINLISSQMSHIELSEGALTNVLEYLVELFENSFKGLFLLCPVNLGEIVKALLDTVRSKQVTARVKMEVSSQGYEKLENAGCLSWPNAEICLNPELEADQCRLSYLDIVVEYDKKFLQSELDSALSCAKFIYKA